MLRLTPNDKIPPCLQGACLLSIQMCVVNHSPVPSTPLHPLPWKASTSPRCLHAPPGKETIFSLWKLQMKQIICLSPKHALNSVLLNSVNCSVLHSVEAITSLTELFLAATGKRELLAKGGALIRCCLQA